mgnify:CR=1 FL=1
MEKRLEGVLDNDIKDSNDVATVWDTETQDTIDAYIALQPVEVQPILQEVRGAIHAVLPDAKEQISWKMPTFWSKHNIIHFASHKSHLGLYPGVEAIVHFSDRLQGYKTSKGAIQFQYSQPIPYDLIAEIALWCYESGDHG